MGDDLEIENSSSEKVQSGHSNTASQSVSQMGNNEGSLHELSKFDLDLKSMRLPDIAQFDAILPGDSNTQSVLQDVRQDQDPVQNHEDQKALLISSYGFNGDGSVKEKIYSLETGFEISSVKNEDQLLMNRNMNMEREMMLVNSPLLNQHSSFKDDEKFEDNNGSKETLCDEKNDLSLEARTNGHGGVVSSVEEPVGPTATSREKHPLTETNSAESTLNKPPRPQEKDTSKRRLISFRALVRMKGLGRRMRKKHHFNKKREKYSNSRNEGGQIKELKSDSSAKYLLESSTSTSEEQTFTQKKISPRKEEPSFHRPKTLQRSHTLNSFKDSTSPNTDELFFSSSESICSAEYLERRRGAMCEELEKTLLCGKQSLADLRAILVVQQKLTGFGLL